MNKITIIGNLTKDVEVQTLSNTSVTKFTVAVKQRHSQEDKVDFFNCSAFGKLGTDVIAKYTKKGSKVAVSGRMESNTKDQKTYWGIVVEDIELLNKNQNEELQLTEDEECPF